ncbi:hypothetical protein [Sinorhizobium sojae]|nr:hypothetical protein [Sinorhizobium sojae]
MIPPSAHRPEKTRGAVVRAHHPPIDTTGTMNYPGIQAFLLSRHGMEEITMRRDSQRFPVVELIALIASLAVVSAIMVVTLLVA